MESSVSKLLSSGDPIKANAASSLEKISSCNEEIFIPYEFYQEQSRVTGRRARWTLDMEITNHRGMNVRWFQIQRFRNMNLIFGS